LHQFWIWLEDKFIGGVCWMISELSLRKIQMPTDAKLLCIFADGSRAKYFVSLFNLKNPAYNVLGVCEVDRYGNLGEGAKHRSHKHRVI
jgi:hypothetical protein